MGETLIIPNPAGGPPFRANVVALLCDLTTNDFFVGKLCARPNDKRRYTHSFIEGGLNEGEEPALAFERELMEEVGLDNAVFLTALNTPIPHFFDDPDKYCGKLCFVAVFGLANKNDINLNPGLDHEGQTFASCEWKPFSDAIGLLRNTITTPQGNRYLDEIYNNFKQLPSVFGQYGASAISLTTPRAEPILPQKLFTTTLPKRMPPYLAA